ncbi:MAG: hypothetical protein U9N82_09175 [Thermodesulfobacteriota bacterium]|nr:hypothetical protein [Thermodesulfobacteriota bacterium]
MDLMFEEVTNHALCIPWIVNFQEGPPSESAMVVDCRYPPCLHLDGGTPLKF